MFCPQNCLAPTWLLPCKSHQDSLPPAQAPLGSSQRLKPLQKLPPLQAAQFNYHIQVDLSNWAYKAN